MTIGERIKESREAKEITQSQLAKSIHSTKQTIYKYENNIVTNIPLSKIERIAETLDTTPAYLMGWEEEQNIADQLSELIHNDLYSEVFDRLMRMSDKTIRRYIKYGDFLIEEQEDDN